ncbi:MAG: hypothetical protein ACOYWZ_11895 [Bacillota bacterium]
MMNSKKIIFGFSAFTAVGITAYWSLVFAGLFPVEEVIPGYKHWFMSFAVADFWIAINSILLAISIKKDNIKKSIIFGLITASSMIFLGLYALLYGINTGLIFNLTVDELIEIAIKVYCLSVGAYFIKHFSHDINKIPKSV